MKICRDTEEHATLKFLSIADGSCFRFANNNNIYMKVDNKHYTDLQTGFCYSGAMPGLSIIPVYATLYVKEVIDDNGTV